MSAHGMSPAGDSDQPGGASAMKDVGYADVAVAGRTATDSLGEVAYHKLSEMIISGELKPGDALREERLAASMGISRVPVREALQRLRDEGWVDRLARRGARVKVPSARDIEEVFEMRLLLEAETVRRAILHISLASAGELRAVVAAGRRAIESGDASGVVEANGRFHSGIAQLSNNSVLASMLQMLDKRVRWMFGAVALYRGEESLAEHERLLDRLVAHDVAGSVELINEHVNTTRQLLLDRWPH